MVPPRFQIVRNSSDLQRQTWDFFFYSDRMKIYLVVYKSETRRSARCKKWETQEYYNHYSRYSQGGMLKLEDVPIPEDVRVEAKELFVKGIEVSLWT